MTKGICARPVKHDGKLYGVGDKIEAEKGVIETLRASDALQGGPGKMTRSDAPKVAAPAPDALEAAREEGRQAGLAAAKTGKGRALV